MLLNNQRITEEMKEEVRTYLETTENDTLNKMDLIDL